MAMTEWQLANVKGTDWERIENTIPAREKHWSWDEEARKAVVMEKRRARWVGWRVRRENFLATL